MFMPVPSLSACCTNGYSTFIKIFHNNFIFCLQQDTFFLLLLNITRQNYQEASEERD